MTGAQMVPLGELCRLRSGYSFKSSTWQAEGTPVLQIGNVRDGFVDTSSLKYVSTEVAEEAKRFALKNGETIIAMTGYVGSVAPITSRTAGMLLNQRVGRLEQIDLKRVDETFLYWSLRAPAVKAQMVNLARGSAQPNLSANDFGKISIQLHPLDEQRRIAGVLSALDDLIDTNERLLDAAELLSDAIYKQSISAVSTSVRVEDIAVFENKLRKPLSSSERGAMPGDYPYYGATGVMDRVGGYLFDGQRVLVGEDGSVVTSDGGPIVQYVWGKFWVNNHAHVLTGRGSSTELLRVVLRNSRVADAVTGAVQPKLSMRNLKDVTVQLPDVSFVERPIAQLAELERELTIESRELAQVRDELLPLLMSGKVRVLPDADNDQRDHRGAA